MRITARFRISLLLAGTVGAALIAGACSQDAPLATDSNLSAGSALEARAPRAELNEALAVLRRATARYHDIDAAVADGFVFLHECEDRPGEAPVGIVYVHFGRLMDGIIDPAAPEGLLYEPGRAGRLELVGAELAIPFPLWTEEGPPEFFDAQFQPEEEFGVFGLHVWLWRHNPEGMFAAGNPRVSCEPTS